MYVLLITWKKMDFVNIKYLEVVFAINNMHAHLANGKNNL